MTSIKRGSALYRTYYRVDKETGKKEYLRTNMFKEPAFEWVEGLSHADHYGSYDGFLTNAQTLNLEVDTDKYEYDFEEVR